uniref:Methylmalonyl-CoA decarboxylase subunit delta n=1 Tax=Propionigenium modestum TaxID=2333 RepID=MMDD_PROMO|nr:RecName: Full=Methylmalonyl-CoA decarboxylase subunit delta [Propionigenium modestum]CAA05138.1 methylmalonyl-CoA decarboxylase, delta-subunit [Propionigenium modestum]
MNITELMELFSNPETIKTLETGDLMTGIGVTVVLGMGITVVALIFLMYIIGGMAAIMAEKPKEVKETAAAAPKPEAAAAPAPAANNDEELVAVIAAAVAAQLGTSASNLIIRNVTRSLDTTPAWGRAGIVDQMATRL